LISETTGFTGAVARWLLVHGQVGVSYQARRLPRQHSHSHKPAILHVIQLDFHVTLTRLFLDFHVPNQQVKLPISAASWCAHTQNYETTTNDGSNLGAHTGDTQTANLLSKHENTNPISICHQTSSGVVPIKSLAWILEEPFFEAVVSQQLLFRTSHADE
jgi:hypothetical protein